MCLCWWSRIPFCLTAAAELRCFLPLTWAWNVAALPSSATTLCSGCVNVGACVAMVGAPWKTKKLVLSADLPTAYLFLWPNDHDNHVWYCSTAPAFTLAASQVHNIQTADGDGGCREAPAHPNLDLAACTTVETTVFFTLTALVTGQNYKCCTTSLCSSIYSLQRDPF